MDNLKSTVLIWTALAKGLGLDWRDVETVSRRASGEGLKFLTVQLAGLGKDLDRALITGEPFRITGRFECYKNTHIPLLMHTWFFQVLKSDGCVREKPNIQVIAKLRQLLLFCYKLKVPHDNDNLEAHYRAFIERDAGLTRDIDWNSALFRRARSLVARVLGGTNPFELYPRHGSGAVAERLRQSEKWSNFAWHPRLGRVFPYEDVFYYNTQHFCDDLHRYINEVPVVEEPCARIVAVPKDSRGPRLICCEPAAHQYVQQGLMRLMYSCIENSSLTRGYVNFTSQDVNGELAQLGSEFGILSTLDLKDASDRVRWDLVQNLFPKNWVEALDACRTRLIECNGTIIEPKKFAPMGSAVCFPVESLVFWALLKAAQDGPVWVYGDDIVVETRCVEASIDCLESFDLKVNVEKSCWRTPFRESCGFEFFNGLNIDYIKLRCFFGDSSNTSYISSIQLVNLLTERWGYEVSYRAKELCEQAYGPIATLPFHDSLCFYGQTSSATACFFKKRWNHELQIEEYFIPTIITPSRGTGQCGWFEMLRKEASNLTSTGSPYGGAFENYSPGVYTAPERCTIKFRWRSIV